MAESRTARDLLNALLEAMGREWEAALPLFADNAAYEAPYCESLGLPWRHRGRDELGRLLDVNRALLPQLEIHDLLIVAESADRVVAEYQFTARSTRTGRMIHQLVVCRLDSADGRITLLRETINLVELALAMYPQGLADYRVPFDRAIWLHP